jgi:hypothetical protein
MASLTCGPFFLGKFNLVIPGELIIIKRGIIKMDSIGFYIFDITTGSAIQIEALFDIFDDLSSIQINKRPSTVNIN